MGPLVRSLWLVQRYGKADAAAPENDQKLKGTLSKALGKGAVLTAKGVQGLMEPSTFEKLAGSDGNLDAAEVRAALDADVPESRRRLNPKVAAHADLLTTSFDMIDEPHRAAGETLVDWIVENYKPGQPLHVTVVCTGQQPPEHPRGDDGQRRRRLLRDARGPVPQRRHRPDRLQPPHRRLPEGDRRRGRADRHRGPPGRAEDGQPGLHGPLGRAGTWRRPSSRRPTSTPATPRRASPP